MGDAIDNLKVLGSMLRLYQNIKARNVWIVILGSLVSYLQDYSAVSGYDWYHFLTKWLKKGNKKIFFLRRGKNVIWFTCDEMHLLLSIDPMSPQEIAYTYFGLLVFSCNQGSLSWITPIIKTDVDSGFGVSPRNWLDWMKNIMFQRLKELDF